MENILDHVRLECKFLAEGETKPNPFLKAWLLESHGIPDQLDNMMKAILAEPLLKNTYTTWQKDPDKPAECSFDMFSLVKDIKRNFIGPNSYLKVTFERKGYPNPQTRGAYAGAYKAQLDLDTGKLDKASIEITCQVHPSVDFFQVQIALRSTLSHELVHAYEDFNRQCLGGRSLGTVLSDRGYAGVRNRENLMEWFKYVLDPAEQHSFIAQTCLEVEDGVKRLKEMGKLDRYEKIRNVDQVLSYTRIWTVYKIIQDWIYSTQWNRMPPYRQKEFVDMYNKLVQKDVKSPIKGGKITTYNQFLKKLKSRWEKFDHDLRVKVSQAIAKALYTEAPVDPPLLENKLSESIIYQAF